MPTLATVVYFIKALQHIANNILTGKCMKTRPLIKRYAAYIMHHNKTCYTITSLLKSAYYKQTVIQCIKILNTIQSKQNYEHGCCSSPLMALSGTLVVV